MNSHSPDNHPHRIVIVGGGAGGLELATALGNRLGKQRKAHITLIDKARSHFWKPHLHEVAAGTMNLDVHATDYLAQSHEHGFSFRIGEMTGIDRQRRIVQVAPYFDEDGEQVTGPQDIVYDTLVIAIGSLTNDFGTPGVKEFAIALETPMQAERFHRRLVNACLRAHSQRDPLRKDQLHIAIIGAGATGVELAAELHKSMRTLVSYGLNRIDAERDICLDLIEAGARILPALPERISNAAHKLLLDLNVQIHLNARVTAINHDHVQLANGTFIPAELIVWAAGVKASETLHNMDGLETNHLNQLVVLPTLQTTRDTNIFAIGDCAVAPWIGKTGAVPPRAQAAHQQAAHLAKQLVRHLNNKPLKPWRYRDFGSLVSLGKYTTVGNLMGKLVGGNFWVEGLFARLMYISLYKMHEIALHGYWHTFLDTASRLLTRRTEPRVKLH
ncbi:MAG TPA: NAD(P)/FAD-dependent oxidoreductase [Steroidobacteraceae bacterium]|nr:NAD(P)/FAD-dependent oxidoreductase [Steroidobacteraceae bacterium]